MHRFKESHVFTANDIIANNDLDNAARVNPTGPGGLGEYEVHVDYDMNGNITALNRMAYGTNMDMDQFEYIYQSGTNKLDTLKDAGTKTGAGGFGDIVSDATTGIYYQYHDDGSLKADEEEEIDYIDWYPNGKIKRIYRTSASTKSDLYFEYDPMGGRVLKVEMTRTGTTINPSTDWIYTYYGSDANGITMEVYKLDTDTPTLTSIEKMIYGGSRLGMQTESEDVTTFDYINQCNSDGLTSAVVKITDPEVNETIEIVLDGVVIGTGTWSTMQSDESNVLEIVTDINDNANGYYAYYVDNGTYFDIIIKETVAGAFSGTLTVEEDDVVTNPTWVTRQPTIGTCAAERELGTKFYELTNHLGNVMEVISDRKIAHSDGSIQPQIDYFEADIVSYSDYYPFGMEMPGRNGLISGGDYRFAFNGMETDKEVSPSGNGKNSYTTQFRQYDPRLGRWKSLDPLAGKYPGQSPFVGYNNNPLYFVDPLGLEGDEPKADKQNRQGQTPSQKNEEKYIDENHSDPDDKQTVIFDYSTEGYKNVHTYTYDKDKQQWNVKTEYGTAAADRKTREYVYIPGSKVIQLGKNDYLLEPVEVAADAPDHNVYREYHVDKEVNKVNYVLHEGVGFNGKVFLDANYRVSNMTECEPEYGDDGSIQGYTPVYSPKIDVWAAAYTPGEQYADVEYVGTVEIYQDGNLYSSMKLVPLDQGVIYDFSYYNTELGGAKVPLPPNGETITMKITVTIVWTTPYVGRSISTTTFEFEIDKREINTSP